MSRLAKPSRAVNRPRKASPQAGGGRGTAGGEIMAVPGRLPPPGLDTRSSPAAAGTPLVPIARAMLREWGAIASIASATGLPGWRVVAILQNLRRERAA